MIDLCTCVLYADEQGRYCAKDGKNLYLLDTAVLCPESSGKVEKLYLPEARRCDRDLLNQIVRCVNQEECCPEFDGLWLCKDEDTYIACDNLRDRALIEEFADETSAILWLRDDRLSWEDMP